MTGAPTKPAAMEGGGAYNRNSTLQAANLTSALPLFEAAAAAVPLDDAPSVVIADYGSSEGRNSLQPMNLAIAALRQRTDRPVEVVHCDLPSNDFRTLFTMLDGAEASYLSHPEVYASAIGRSHFGTVLPRDRVHLGWTSNALHWLSRNPVDVPDHGWAILSASAEARALLGRQLDEDWRNFLIARSAELRPGGRLVGQFMGHGPDSHGFEWMAGLFWESIVAMKARGLVDDDELLRMTNPSAGRTSDQISAPFAGGSFAGLRLTHLSLYDAPDPFWDAYQQSGDAAALGQGWARMMRVANGPTFAAALRPERDREAFLDGVTDLLAERVRADPQRSRSHMILFALEKEPAG